MAATTASSSSSSTAPIPTNVMAISLVGVSRRQRLSLLDFFERRTGLTLSDTRQVSRSYVAGLLPRRVRRKFSGTFALVRLITQSLHLWVKIAMR